ncbi:MAG: hypothetical protein PF589_09650 [Gammaproteobacteria bacterium]|nr:hypothetical protein [Gammaproteobacteria bacterium]
MNHDLQKKRNIPAKSSRQKPGKNTKNRRYKPPLHQGEGWGESDLNSKICHNTFSIKNARKKNLNHYCVGWGEARTPTKSRDQPKPLGILRQPNILKLLSPQRRRERRENLVGY